MAKLPSDPTWRVRARDPVTTEAALDLARRIARDTGRCSDFVELAGARAFVKASPLAGMARARWTLKTRLFRAPTPREREYANLDWLRARLFLAPEPLAVVVGSRAGSPCFQMLATRAVQPSKPMLSVRVAEEHEGRG